jgi:hypothetical protein
VFAPLLEIIQREQEKENPSGVLLVDSFPVTLARQGHRFKACVAKDLADSGYCSTKKLYFHGIRVHGVGRRCAGTLPSPEYIGITPASYHDGKVFDPIRPQLAGEDVYGDKAYQRSDAQEIQKRIGLQVFTPVKKKKGQKHLEADEERVSTEVSRIRQPIEALLGWISEKTGVEFAGKVRSSNGLLVHVFGRLAAAMFFWNYLRISS